MSESAVVEWKPKAVATYSDAINVVMPHLAEIAPRNLNLNKFKALLQIELSKCPDVEKCDPLDVMKVVSDIATLGLEPGNEVTLRTFYSRRHNKHLLNKMVGFQGWYRILIESPRIKKVVTDVVCKGDDFYQDRINDEYRHIVPQNAPRSEVTHAYCVVTLDNGEKLYRVLDMSDINRHRKAAQNSGETGPWHDHFAVMAMKSAMQSFASRHKGLINAIAREALAQDETAMFEEYRNTPPSQSAYDAAVVDLFGDAPDVPAQKPMRTGHPVKPRVEYTVEDGDVIRHADEDDDIPDVSGVKSDQYASNTADLDEAQHAMAERAHLADYLRQHQFGLNEVKNLVAQVAEELGTDPNTPFDQIMRLAWIDGIKAKAEGIVQIREEIEQAEVADAETTEEDANLL